MTRRILAVPALALMIAFTGCGQSFHPVTGQVTLDGQPVEGASVNFSSEDGKTTGFGVTDSGGNFTITCQDRQGLPEGSYKVTVAKYPKVTGDIAPTDGGFGKDYFKQMKKQADASKGGKKMPGMPPGMPPGAMPPGMGGTTTSARSEFPEKYAAVDQTPFSVNVPTDGPVKLDMEGGKKGNR